jgi:hypothetical protein
VAGVAAFSASDRGLDALATEANAASVQQIGQTAPYRLLNQHVYARMNLLAELLRREVNSRRPDAARVALLKCELAASVERLR